jgi:predicted ArsR family transcriptional regulator
MSNLFDRLQDEINSQESQEGISPVDLLDLPASISKIIKKIIRRNGMKLEEIAQELDQSVEQAKESLDELVAKGYVRQVEVKEVIWYKARFAQKRNRTLSAGFWSALGTLTDSDEEETSS